MVALALDDVSASFGEVRVLGPLSLTVNRGEQVALVGKSGAGKSTLLSLMYKEARIPVAYMPQALGLVETLSVFHNVYMGRLSQHPTWYNLANLVWPQGKQLAAIVPILESLQLAEKRKAPAGELSGGQRQRTAAARVIFQGAELLLADEPVSALDGPLAHVVMQSLSQAYPTSVIAMHDVELALRYTQRIVGIQHGKVVLDEPSHRLSPGDLLPLYQG
ncbi:MAG: ATP-binding cassette domain-containing protein [Halomonadaceae bacterium]|nr:MAG: ATP-binding cassette domain-containing protein [Halomonadaceae bacterium]